MGPLLFNYGPMGPLLFYYGPMGPSTEWAQVRNRVHIKSKTLAYSALRTVGNCRATCWGVLERLLLRIFRDRPVFEGYLVLCESEKQVQTSREQGAHDIISFQSKQLAQQYIDAGQEWWVVFAGTSVSVMSEDQCVDATCDYHAPKI